MKNKTSVILAVLLALVVGFFAGVVVPNNNPILPGSVTVGNEYQYQQFSGAIATTTAIAGYQVALGSELSQKTQPQQ